MHLHHSHTKKIIGLVLLLVVIGGGWYWYAHKVNDLEKRLNELQQAPLSSQPAGLPEQHQPLPSEQHTTLYNNATYHYQVAYPDNFQLKEYNKENAVIGTIDTVNGEENVNGKVNLTVITAKTAAEKKAKLEDFLFDRVKLLCDADGGGVSVRCPKKISLTSLAIPSGLPAYTLTLQREEHTVGPEASVLTDESVFLAVDISSGEQKTILVIYPVGDGTDELAKAIAQSTSRHE